MPLTADTAFHVRVMLSIGVIARTPSLAVPTSVAGVPSSVSSAVGTLRVPSLSLSRLTVMLRSRPLASRSSTKNSASPRLPSGLPSGRASVNAISDAVADVNHLVPYRRHWSPSLRATVSVRETSEPPVRSVIHWPLVHITAGSRLISRVTYSAISCWFPLPSRVRAAPSVIASGHE